MRKEKIIRTEEEIEYIKSFIINHGFTTMTEFAKAIGMKRQILRQNWREYVKNWGHSKSNW